MLRRAVDATIEQFQRTAQSSTLNPLTPETPLSIKSPRFKTSGRLKLGLPAARRHIGIVVVLFLLNSGIANGATAVDNQINGSSTEPASIEGSTPDTKSAADGEQESIPVLLQTKGPMATTKSKKIAAVSPAASTDSSPPQATADQPFGLSAETVELAQKWDVLDPLKHLAAAHASFVANKNADSTIEYLLAKHDVTERLMALSFDVQRINNEIDTEIGYAQERAASLAERRDRAIRYNTYANLIAGGITGILSGAISVANFERITPDVIDIAEGVGQSGLSIWALKAEYGRENRVEGEPSVLAYLLEPKPGLEKQYPPSVRVYLGSVSRRTNSTESRGDELVDRWTNLNFCLRHSGSGHKKDKMELLKRLSNTHKHKSATATLTIDLLEDRIAMLQDLRARISHMHNHLAEILEVVRRL